MLANQLNQGVGKSVHELDLTKQYIATIKFDGVRVRVLQDEQLCTKTGEYERVFASKNGKRLANNYLRELLGSAGLGGCDGELLGGALLGKAAYKQAISAAMTHDSVPEKWQYLVFDYFGDGSEEFLAKPWHERIAYARRAIGNLPSEAYGHVRIAEPIAFANAEYLEVELHSLVDSGAEGIMLQDINAPYLLRRCTPKQSYTCKLKPFADAEGTIIGFEEAKFSAGKTIPKELHGKPKGQAAVLLLQTKEFGEIKVAGLEHGLAKDVFTNLDNYLGKVVTYKYQKSGSDRRPRHPTFLRFRED